MMSQVLQSAMLGLVQQYVNRQQIVSEVIHQLRPDLVMLSEHVLSEQTVWTQEWQEWLERFEQQQKLVASIPQRGYWGPNQEWLYFFHGGGCKLVHVLTGEPINWNLPDLDRFDKFWFLEYLNWLLSQDTLNDFASAIKVAYDNSSGALQ